MIEVNIYQRPDGRKLRTLINKVDQEDAQFFKRHGIIIGMEELDDNQYAVYGQYPDQDEEDEVIVLSNGRSCNEALKEVRELLEKVHEDRPANP